MITKILKRDGRKVTFNLDKITYSIFKAAQSIGGKDFEMSESLTEIIANYLDSQKFKNNIPSSQEIQNTVEKILIEKGHIATAKAYISYRNERTKLREKDSKIMNIIKNLTFSNFKDNNTKSKNLNINKSMDTMFKYGSESAKQFYLEHILKPEYAKAHVNGDIYIHNLDFLTLSTTSCQIDLIKLFKDGFSTCNSFLKEPNSIESYASLASIALQSNQNDQHGEQSISNFEYTMALGVKKTYRKNYIKNLAKAIELLTNEKNCENIALNIVNKIKEEFDLIPSLNNSNNYLEKEREELLNIFYLRTTDEIQKFATKYAKKETENSTYQAMKSFIYNLNTIHSRTGAKLPLTSINYGLDTTEEGRLVMINLLKATEAGLGNGESPIFPIQIFKIKEGINYNKEDINYDIFKLACNIATKRSFPNFSFIDAPFNLPYYKEGDYHSEVAYMGCLTRVMSNIYDKNKEISCGRGNLSITSINLPRLAIYSKNNIETFFNLLNEKIELVSNQLLQRLEIQSKKKAKNYPFLIGQNIWINSEKISKNDEIREILKHGTLSIGFIGLAESLISLIGKHHGESQEAQKLGLKIISFMKEKVNELSNKYSLNFTLTATSPEDLSQFIKKDKEKFGIIKGVTDKEYYTNSFHIPLYYKISPFEKIKIEAPYHNLTTGGHICYIELNDNSSKNINNFEQIIRCMKESGIGYGTINYSINKDEFKNFKKDNFEDSITNSEIKISNNSEQNTNIPSNLFEDIELKKNISIKENTLNLNSNNKINDLDKEIENIINSQFNNTL